ncbi:hypothetical protein C1645_824290 [Glomus cerebriforme]|uniref:Uncharacterized protein n=1 Tax=Glomus cerebriforme TaxID=658196 RepID=A0A397T135_9GLOM|nr:hypothetical protein C1645_824290 [Glomus cerebriforme]
MNIINYSRNNLTNNVYESNFTGFNNFDNLLQAITVGPSIDDNIMNDMHSDNVNNVPVNHYQTSNPYLVMLHTITLPSPKMIPVPFLSCFLI